jgi:hypothetical protein
VGNDENSEVKVVEAGRGIFVAVEAEDTEDDIDTSSACIT